MKKIIFFLAIFFCSFKSDAQISGVVNFQSSDWFGYHEYGNVVEFEYNFCLTGVTDIHIEFEQEDNYTATGNGYLMEGSNSTSYTLSFYGDLGYTDTVKIYGENQGLMIQFLGNHRWFELESFRLSNHHNIVGDTIFLCNDYGTDGIVYEIEGDVFGGDILTVGNYDYENNADGVEFHVNDSVFPIDISISDYNFKTGDVIKLQTDDNHTVTGDRSCPYYYCPHSRHRSRFFVFPSIFVTKITPLQATILISS